MSSEKPIVVSNASPLINLARIGHLDLLQAVYNELVIPQAVWEEVVVAGAGQPGAEQVRQADWIRVRPVTNRHLVNALHQDLDAGEAETIALAAELGADLILMDERLGRETARHLGLRCVGVDRYVDRSQASGPDSGSEALPGYTARCCRLPYSR